MFILDSVRPYLVSNSLYNSALTVLAALPATLLFGWLFLKMIERVAAKHKQQILFALGLSVGVELVNFWLLPSLGLRFAYLAWSPYTILWLGVGPALAWTVAPTVALFVFLNRPAPRLLPIESVVPSRYAFLKTTLVTCMLLLCNGSVPLLLSGGRPFNATHTLPSWIFTESWVNGDSLHALVQAGLLSIVLLGCSTILLLCQPVNRNGKLRLWLLLPTVVPTLWSVVPYIFRFARWIDGRVPLLVTELLVVLGIVLGCLLFKAIANPMHRNKPARVGRVRL